MQKLLVCNNENAFIGKILTVFPCILITINPPIPKVTHIQCDEGDNRLALRLGIAEYQIAEPKHKCSFKEIVH